MLREMNLFSLIKRSLRDYLTEVSSYQVGSYKGDRLGRIRLDCVSP